MLVPRLSEGRILSKISILLGKIYCMNDKWLLAFGIPIIGVISFFVFKFDGWDQVGLRSIPELGVSMIMTSIIWFGNRFIWFKFLQYYPGFHNTFRRLLRQIPSSLIYTISVNIILLFILVPNFKDVKTYMPNVPWYISCNWFSVFMASLVLAIYESRYFFDEWKKNIQKAEALAHAHTQTQFEALKKQLDPHFLFNSLNTLASLIDIKNKQAQLYLERLSDVYRYVLETRNKSTVTVEEELQFLEAYVYLIKVRYRDNIVIHQHIPAEIQSTHIPALSLQILVENAIKHNIISQHRPLHIDIKQEGDHIIIVNNKQIKQTLGISTRIGLQNIIERYQLLDYQNVEVLDSDATFTVKLPILKPA